MLTAIFGHAHTGLCHSVLAGANCGKLGQLQWPPAGPGGLQTTDGWHSRSHSVYATSTVYLQVHPRLLCPFQFSPELSDDDSPLDQDEVIMPNHPTTQQSDHLQEGGAANHLKELSVDQQSHHHQQEAVENGFGLTFEQEQTADQLLADIQSAVDEMLHDFQLGPLPPSSLPTTTKAPTSVSRLTNHYFTHQAW